jgi:histidine triad (HIT) family protein
MESIFTKIINREIPAYIIEENDDFIAFLDVFPIAKGHTLVIPKKQVDYIFDLDEETHAALWKFAKKVSLRVNATIPCKRVGVAVIGLEVPHAHIHLVPLNSVEDINFSNPKLKLTENELITIHKKMIQH